MKKLILSIATAAFALTVTAQADEAKTASVAEKAKAASKGSCCDKCCDSKVAKKVDMAVKGATLLVMK